MNPDTGHLMKLSRDEKLREGYEFLPKSLERAARQALDNKPAAQVDLHARTPLAQWAKKKRRAKIAAESRRRNRK